MAQQSRLARMRMSKYISSNALIELKRRVEQRAEEMANDPLQAEKGYVNGDVFQLQHQHLISCLEKTTVSESLFH